MAPVTMLLPELVDLRAKRSTEGLEGCDLDGEGGYESLCRSTFVAGIVSGATSSGDVVGGGGELCGKWGLLPLQFRLAYDCTATERSAVALKHYH